MPATPCHMVSHMAGRLPPALPLCYLPAMPRGRPRLELSPEQIADAAAAVAGGATMKATAARLGISRDVLSARLAEVGFRQPGRHDAVAEQERLDQECRRMTLALIAHYDLCQARREAA